MATHYNANGKNIPEPIIVVLKRIERGGKKEDIKTVEPTLERAGSW